MQTDPQRRTQQQGAATLLITLVLTMSITIITLAVARTQLVEQRISSNDNWNTRLLLQAESGLARGIVYLNSEIDNLSWSTDSGDKVETSSLTLPMDQPEIDTELVFSRTAGFDRTISIQATARRNDGSNILARASQYVRLLSVLTPLAESLPPLVINGCPTGLPRTLDIRPQHADTGQAGDAVWSGTSATCPLPGATDIHNGAQRNMDMGNGVWPLVFSVSREEFLLLAEGERSLPQQQYYRVAPASGTGRHTWSTDLGSVNNPVVLYFPPETGCPVFSTGTTIYGIIYIDAGCPDPVAGEDVSIIGSLVVDGSLNISNSGLQLNNIQIADSEQTRLDFPVLRSVRVPGTWKDF
ncbi:MAG: PilX N-terminal domain-containing pilus assembly protein [Thiogranum sp.]